MNNVNGSLYGIGLYGTMDYGTPWKSKNYLNGLDCDKNGQGIFKSLHNEKTHVQKKTEEIMFNL